MVVSTSETSRIPNVSLLSDPSGQALELEPRLKDGTCTTSLHNTHNRRVRFRHTCHGSPDCCISEHTGLAARLSPFTWQALGETSRRCDLEWKVAESHRCQARISASFSMRRMCMAASAEWDSSDVKSLDVHASVVAFAVCTCRFKCQRAGICMKQIVLQLSYRDCENWGPDADRLGHPLQFSTTRACI